ncbi:MAG TPA: CvpA family protein, partial [Anaerolineae bacterium]|nr:CvpA family protein [Anaerolineae bacterium]
MMSIQAVFWVFVGFFAVIGAMRGWAKETVAAAGIVLSLFAINLLGSTLENFFPETATPAQRFGIKTAIFLAIVFFSYQGPTLAAAVSGGKLAARARAKLQDTLLGLVVGILNGYLVAGTVWFFLQEQGYPFPNMIQVPPGGWESIVMAQKYLPLIVLEPWLPYLVV